MRLETAYILDTSIPLQTRPNTVCLLSSHGVGTTVTKKLGSICVRSCIGHAQCIGPIMPQLKAELVFKLPTPDGLPPSPCAEWVSSLDHELPDNPVEDVAIVVTIASMYTEILHSLRTLPGEQVQVDISNSGVYCGILIQPGGAFFFCSRYDVFLARFLVKHISVIVYTAEIFAGPVGEQIESVFLVSRGNQCRVCTQVSKCRVV